MDTIVASSSFDTFCLRVLVRVLVIEIVIVMVMLVLVIVLVLVLFVLVMVLVLVLMIVMVVLVPVLVMVVLVLVIVIVRGRHLFCFFLPPDPVRYVQIPSSLFDTFRLVDVCFLSGPIWLFSRIWLFSGIQNSRCCHLFRFFFLQIQYDTSKFLLLRSILFVLSMSVSF